MRAKLLPKYCNLDIFMSNFIGFCWLLTVTSSSCRKYVTGTQKAVQDKACKLTGGLI